MKFLQNIIFALILLVAHSRAAFDIEDLMYGNVAPTMVGKRQSQVLFAPGVPFRLECDAEGIPSPSYEWTKDTGEFDPSTPGGRITQVPGEGTLIFNNPQPSDEGRYTCIARNTAGVAVTMTMVKNKDKENASAGRVPRFLRSSRSLKRLLRHRRYFNIFPTRSPSKRKLVLS